MDAWNNLNSYLAWFIGTVVGTALGGLLPNPEIFGLDFALVGMFIGIFVSQFQIMQKRIPLRNPLHHFRSCCPFLIYAFDSGVPVTSCTVCDLARLYNGGWF